MVFLDLATGFPGRIHYSRVLRCTALNQDADQRRTLSMATETVQDVAMRRNLLGDGGYPLKPWLITSYKFSVNRDRIS